MLNLSVPKSNYFPGETVSGFVDWQIEKNPTSIEIRLIWYTRGKGTVDVGLVDRFRVENPGSQGRQEFTLKLPAMPYSFSGKLISLIWAIEVVVEPGGRNIRQDLIMSPTGQEVILHSSANAG